MDKLKELLTAILGPSWLVSLLGYIGIISGAAELIKDAVAKDGFPTDEAGWAMLIAGAIGTSAKGKNVTHAPIPLPEAKPAPEQSGIQITDAPPPLPKK